MITIVFETKYSTRPFPRMRNGVLDIVHEGKKRDTIYLTFEVDMSEVHRAIQALKAQGKRAPSITTYMIRCFARTIDENKIFNAYRKGRKELIVFDDVDVAIPVERDVNGFMQPVYHVVRAANIKDVNEIQAEIDRIKESRWEEIMPSIDKSFFGKWPDFMRRIFWYITKARPRVKKYFSGTVGLTSVGMFGSGKVHLFPLTPMTSTLAVGGLDTRLILVDGKIITHEMLCLTLCVDHEIIDGAPAMRFITRFKEIAEKCFELSPAENVDMVTSNFDSMIEKVACNVASSQS
jgi:pyruvate/2-oxoglutarate dehydrogenase complex dihydrolipoamide acyltransferase (E2) component